CPPLDTNPLTLELYGNVWGGTTPGREARSRHGASVVVALPTMPSSGTASFATRAPLEGTLFLFLIPPPVFASTIAVVVDHQGQRAVQIVSVVERRPIVVESPETRGIVASAPALLVPGSALGPR